MAEIDLGALAAQATEMLNTETTSTPVETSPSTPSSDPNVTADSTPQSSTPSPETPAPADPTYDVDLGNGKVEKLTQAQLKDAYLNGLRQADYTRKTQELSVQRQQAEMALAQYQQAQQQLQYYDSLLKNPQALQVLAQQQAQAQQPIDPNAPMTIGQAQQMAQVIAQQLEAVKQMNAQSIPTIQQAAQQIVDNRMAVANYAENINSTLTKVYAEHPVLKSIPEFEDVVRYRVAKLEPSSIEEAQQHFEAVSKDIASKLESSFNARKQQQEVQKAQLSKAGIEPPGGQVVPLQKPEYVKDGKVDWNRLHEAAKNIQ